ncbi:hypothetical protein ACH4T9_26465 [Micromonospora sp. NPDC020750]
MPRKPVYEQLSPIRLALRILDERGWIEVYQGKGSFVAPEPPA